MRAESLAEPTLVGQFRHGSFFISVDVEHLLQTHQIENFSYVLVDAAKTQLDLLALAGIATIDHLADHGRRHKTDVLKIESNFLVGAIAGKLKQLLTDRLDSTFVDQADVLKIDNQN